jgi:LacI family transcriptional regulator
MLEVVATMRGRVDGLVVMAPDVAVTPLRESLAPDMPVVLLNSSDREHDAITIDNFGGARAMMRYLFSLGHRSVAFIKGPAQNADARERLRGYRQSMRAHGTASRELEFEGDFTERSGYAAAAQIADADPRPTAIFGANDSMAVGALSALDERGVAVPREMSVVGFDDIPIAHYVAPSLTTIRIEIAELGRRSFALLHDAIASSRKTQRQECIGTTLVVRESSAPRAAAAK